MKKNYFLRSKMYFFSDFIVMMGCTLRGTWKYLASVRPSVPSCACVHLSVHVSVPQWVSGLVSPLKGTIPARILSKLYLYNSSTSHYSDVWIAHRIVVLTKIVIMTEPEAGSLSLSQLIPLSYGQSLYHDNDQFFKNYYVYFIEKPCFGKFS